MNELLHGKKILIVGGSSGIGLAVTKQACMAGARPVIASRSAAARTDAVSRIVGEKIEAHSFDVTSEDECRKLFSAIGNIDHLVITVRPDLNPSPFEQVDVDEAKLAFDTKFWGQYLLIRQARTYMNTHGSITMTSGIAGEKVYKGASTMGIINSATETLCRFLAVELAPLRVNIVSPGFVEPKARAIQDYAAQFPVGRLASLEDIAAAYIGLMANSYATGIITVIDGGARLI